MTLHCVLISFLLVSVVAAAVAAEGRYREQFPLPSGRVPDGWGPNLGFNDHLPIELQRFREGRFTYVRKDLFWHEVEAVKGKFDFSRYDRFMEQWKELGIRPVFILCYGNAHYENAAPTTPESRAAFVNYVRQAVTHFRGQGVIWEMWNEPNNHHWPPKPNVEHYIALAKEVGQLFKKEFPDEWRVMPGIAGFDWQFFEACLKAGLLEYYDAVTVHPYRPMEPESAEPDYARMRAMIDRYAPKGKKLPILSGEWGYAGAGTVVSDDTQAAYFVRQYLANIANDVPMSIWYNWNNNGVNRRAIIDNYGILTHDFQPKPTFEAGKRLTETLDGFTFDKRLAVGSQRDFLLLFKRDNELRLAAWTTSAKGSTVEGIDLGPGAELIGRDGKRTAVGEKLTLSAHPVYLTPKEGSGWLRAADAWRRLPPSAEIGNAEAAARLLRPLLEGLPDDATLEIRDWPDGSPLPGRPSVTLKPTMKPAEITKALAVLPRLLDRSDRVRRVRATVVQPNLPPMSQDCLTLFSDPLRLSIVPSAAGDVGVVVEAERAGFEGKLQLSVGSELLTSAINVPTGGSQTVKFKPTNRTANAPLRAQLVDKSGLQAATTPVVRVVSIDIVGDTKLGDTPPKHHFEVELGGESQVAAEASAKVIAPPAGLPFAVEKAVELTYQFSPGWRYVQVRTPGEKPLSGSPASFGLWVYGDGSGAELRMRYIDSTGQTFQPDAGAIDWWGWRFVTYSLRGDAAGRWGGANDGIVYAPIRIDTLMVVDSPGGRGVGGKLVVAAPVVLVEMTEIPE